MLSITSRIHSFEDFFVANWIFYLIRFFFLLMAGFLFFGTLRSLFLYARIFWKNSI